MYPRCYRCNNGGTLLVICLTKVRAKREEGRWYARELNNLKP